MMMMMMMMMMMKCDEKVENANKNLLSLVSLRIFINIAADGSEV